MHLTRPSFIAPLVFSFFALGCSGSNEEVSAQPTSSDSAVVAIVDGTPIRQSDLDQWIMEEYLRTLKDNKSEAHEIRSQSLKAMIDQHLLEAKAAEEGLSTKELLEREQGNAGPISDKEVELFYKENQRRMGAATLDQVTEQIRNFLSTTRDIDFHDAYLRSLRADTEIQLLLPRPRVEVAATGITIGPDNAPITIIEFTDYQCPFCERAEPAMRKVTETYPTQVRWVYRHFPLTTMHPQAMDAAKAAICADRQEKFMGVHRALFENKSNLSTKRLNEIAQEQGLDSKAFSTCLQDSAIEAQVKQDIKEGELAGVTGTPAFFLNGIPFSGAKPFEEFDELIQEELARLGSSAN